MKTLIALLKRELLEHKNIWRVPLILIGLSMLVKLSLSVGNLAININVPNELQLGQVINSGVITMISKSLGSMHFIIMVTMFVVAIFYALSCLFNERQDDSVLFWRSLPISDSLSVASKLLIALVAIPFIIVTCQIIVSVLFLGTDSIHYLISFFSQSLPHLAKIVLWSLLPTISWCVFCSEIAKKNPFLLAFIAPILFIMVDKLFLNGLISETFIINRLTNFSNYTFMPLVIGLVFSVTCIALAVVKRSQRI